MSPRKFFTAYRQAFGTLEPEQVGPLEQLFSWLTSEHIDARHTAYMLATVKHETAETYLPVREAFWLSEAWRKRNLRYWPWYGRGFVQLTWERNYKLAGAQLGLDLTTDPDVAMQPVIAYKVMVRGMQQGWFTGVRLADYIGASTDYRRARLVINGLDKAELIAGYAIKFQHCLENSNA